MRKTITEAVAPSWMWSREFFPYLRPRPDSASTMMTRKKAAAWRWVLNKLSGGVCRKSSARAILQTHTERPRTAEAFVAN